jgi:hypothetical protein
LVDAYTSHFTLFPIVTRKTETQSSDSRSGVGINNNQVYGALLTLFSIYGWPRQLFMDNASYFKVLCETLSRKFHLDCRVLPRNAPWRRGRVERCHSEYNKVIRATAISDRNIHENLMICTLMLNNTKRDSISANDVCLSFSPVHPLLQNASLSENEEIVLPTTDELTRRAAIHDDMIAKPFHHFRSENRELNRRKLENDTRTSPFKIDDLVLVRRSTAAKYEAPWRGPVKITEILDDCVLVSDGTRQSAENLKLFLCVLSLSVRFVCCFLVCI